MYEDLGEITLKSGETVRTGVVIAPDLEWAERLIFPLLDVARAPVI